MQNLSTFLKNHIFFKILSRQGSLFNGSDRVYTDNGMVNPGREHEGEDFSGSFISSEFVAYSEKKPQGRKQSDAQYQQYLAKRERALNTAEGTPLDEQNLKVWNKTSRSPPAGSFPDFLCPKTGEYNGAYKSG